MRTTTMPPTVAPSFRPIDPLVEDALMSLIEQDTALAARVAIIDGSERGEHAFLRNLARSIAHASQSVSPDLPFVSLDGSMDLLLTVHEALRGLSNPRCAVGEFRIEIATRRVFTALDAHRSTADPVVVDALDRLVSMLGTLGRAADRMGREARADVPSVLICDDEPDVLALLELHVTRAGLRPRRSLTASECLSMLENARPMARALVVDLLLPDLNGIEICRRVRQGSIWPRVPVIIYTALDDALARERAREAGAHAYVVKSDGVYPLVAAVRCAVDAAA